MLAATCSKIGNSPAQDVEDGSTNNGQTTVDANSSNIRVVVGNGVGQSGGTVINNGIEAVNVASAAGAGGWIQLQNGNAIVDPKSVNMNTGGNVLQTPNNVASAGAGGGHLFAQGQQIVATPGPNGQMTYSMVPSYQTVALDGGNQDAFLIPSPGQQQQVQSVTAATQNSNMLQGAQTAQQTLITPNGQIIRAQGLANTLPSQSAATVGNSNIFQGVSGFGTMGNLVNIGGNIVSLGGYQNAVRGNAGGILQAFQLPGFQTVQQLPNFIQVPMSINGQTVLQTMQLPNQTIPVQAPLQQVNGSGMVTLGSNAQSLQSIMASQGQNQTHAVNMGGQIEDLSQGHTNSPNPAQQTRIPPEACKTDLKSGMIQLSTTHNQASVSSNTSKVASVNMTNNALNGNLQSVNVINTPQGQVLLSSPSTNQTGQASQGLPTLTVPSYPQTITTNASQTSSTTTTASQNVAMLQSVLAQQQLLQGVANTQNLSGIQLAGQNANWLQVRNNVLNLNS